MKYLYLFIVAVGLMSLQGCGYTKMYDGPERPLSEVAHIQSVNVDLVGLNEKKIIEKRIAVLPGSYKVRVHSNEIRESMSRFVKTQYNATVTLKVEAGKNYFIHVYAEEVGFQRAVIKEKVLVMPNTEDVFMADKTEHWELYKVPFVKH